MDDSRQFLLLGLVVGVLVGAAAGFYLAPTERVASPSYGMSTGTGCATDPATGGWVGQIPAGETRTIAFNLTFTHDAADVDVRGNLTESGPGTYRFAVLVTPGDGEKGEPPEGCTPRTTLDASISLPSDYRTLTFVLGDDVVTRVENPEHSFATFRTLSGNYSVSVE